MTRNLLCSLAAISALGCGGPAGEATAEQDVAPASGGEAAECSFGGAWAGTFVGGPYEGREMTWTFSDDGTVRWTSGDLAFDGEWSVEGDVVSVTDTSESGCTGVTGTFGVTYQGGCDEVLVATVEDTCAPRTVSTDGMTLRR